MMKRVARYLILFMAAMLICTPAMAVVLDYTDTTTKSGFDISYSLQISVVDASTYQGIFTIVSNSTSVNPWYIGAFDFKFFDGSGNVIPDITGLSSFSGSTGPWGITDVGNPNISIQGWSRQDGRAGFYLTDLYDSQTVANAQDGVYVSGTNTASFTFTFANTGEPLNIWSMPFQVGYFDSAKSQGGLYFGQLSANLAVPEPATFLLLGSGLVGLAFFGRKRLRG